MRNYAFSTTIIALSVALSAALTGCSNQFRDNQGEVSSEEMMTMLEDAAKAPTASVKGGSELANALALRTDPNVVIYFASAPGTGEGPHASVASVASLVDFAFMGEPSLSVSQIAEVRVFFLDLATTAGNEDGLVIGVKKVGATAFTYYGLYGKGAFGEEDFQAVLKMNGQDKLVLRTFDVVDGDFSATIQMKAFAISAGAEQYIGKFSSLFGFGP